MQGCEGEDYTTNTRKTLIRCGKWGGKKANRLRKDEGTDQSKLKEMGVMGE
jgi:hypothetical protein